MPLTALLLIHRGNSAQNPIFKFRTILFKLVVLMVCAFSLGACQFPSRGSHPNSSQIHEITREMAATARRLEPAGTVIRMKLQATPKDPQVPDSLEITLFGFENAGGGQYEATKLLSAFNAIGETHKLKYGKERDTASSFSVSLHSGNRTTHFIEVRFAGNTPKGQGLGAGADLPRLAIILDDLGSDRAAAETIFSLPYPLTISILPNHEHSREIAEEALQRGYQVMLHLPMQSVANEAPEKEELRPGMSKAQVESLLSGMIESVPNAVGVNNHQGSHATSDAALMEKLMPAVHDWNLFYVDSRTTAATVAFDTAKQDGVPAAFRNVPFLDDVQDVAAIRKQLQLALRGAKEKKSAVAIGHPRPATLEALRAFLPTARSNGVRLVFASELVH